LFGSRFA
jgi:hypothetical protein